MMLVDFVRERLGRRGDRDDGDGDEREEIVSEDDQDGDQLEETTAYATADRCPMCGDDYDEYLTHLNRDCDPE